MFSGTKTVEGKGCLLNKLLSLSSPASFAVAESLSLAEPETYRYLSQSGCVSDENLNDGEMFTKVMVSSVRILLSSLGTVSWAERAAGSGHHRQN